MAKVWKKDSTLYTSWSIYGIDMVNMKHKISLWTMISWIMWEDGDKKMRQLFHSVDSTWNDEGTIFWWLPQFDDQAQTVMTGLLLYLKSQYSNTIEFYFLRVQLLCSPNNVGVRIKGVSLERMTHLSLRHLQRTHGGMTIWGGGGEWKWA